jgi:serine/threonine protein kinase
MEKVKIGKFGFDTEEWGYVSKEAKDFITKMLEKDPKKRYSVIKQITSFNFSFLSLYQFSIYVGS